MKSIKRRRINGSLAPFTLPPCGKYPFGNAIPPGSVVVAKKSRGALRRGQSFRAGYCSWRDGLHCSGPVSDAGKYLQTIDHHCLQNFEIESECQDGSVYGRNRAKWLAIP
jgi:hypothetical protein